jgi:hypothetical protein
LGKEVERGDKPGEAEADEVDKGTLFEDVNLDFWGEGIE